MLPKRIICTTAQVTSCTMQLFHSSNKATSIRGGASKASGATFTDHVAGARDVSARVYHTCVKPLGQLLHTHAQMLLIQRISKLILTRKGNIWKKGSLALEWIRTRVWCIANHCLHHRANGVLEALDFKFGSYSVDCSEWEIIGHQRLLEKANRDSGITGRPVNFFTKNSVRLWGRIYRSPKGVLFYCCGKLTTPNHTHFPLLSWQKGVLPIFRIIKEPP